MPAELDGDEATMTDGQLPIEGHDELLRVMVTGFPFVGQARDRDRTLTPIFPIFEYAITACARVFPTSSRFFKRHPYAR